MSDHLLDVATVVDRDTVGISTKKSAKPKIYELINPDELGAYEYAIFVSRRKKVAGMERTDRKLTSSEMRVYTKAVKDILSQIVIDLEPQVLAEMERSAAEKIVVSWTLKHFGGEADTGAAEGEDRKSPSTTAGSSPDSKRSTAATRRTGSTSRGGR